MKRISLFVLPLVLAAVAFAQDTKTKPDPPKQADLPDLIKKLGDDDYAVREAATKKLIELGDKARPELDQALKSDDLEVRLRAGRALRAIQAGRAVRKDARDLADASKHPKNSKKKAKASARDPLGPGGKVVGTSLSLSNGKIKLKVTRLGKDGKASVKEYEGTSVEQLKKKYPELKDVLGNFRVTTNRGAVNRFRFDMDKFWKKFNKDFNRDLNKEFDKDFWKKWQKDLEAEAKRLNEMSRRWADWEKQRGNNPFGRVRLKDGVWTRLGTRLGVNAAKASPVLDAQLALRGRGIVISTVSANSIAAKLGLKRYDILLELNGVAIRQTQDVATALRTHKAGAKVTARIIRRAAELKLETGQPAAREK